MKKRRQLSLPNMSEWTDEQIAEFWQTHDSADFWEVMEPVDIKVERRHDQFFVTKTGLDNFDVARTWGLAVVLNVLTEDDVELRDNGWAFIVKPVGSIPSGVQLTGLGCRILFAAEDTEWERVFMTLRKKREKLFAKHVKQVRNTLEKKWQELLDEKLRCPGNVVTFGSGQTLLGSLEPAAFKGLRHVTRARYGEDNIKVPDEHWALACLGMATCGTYYRSREKRQEKEKQEKETQWLVLLPIPQSVHFSYFRDVRELMRFPGLAYRGVQNAAAHYAVKLAEQVRRRAAAYGSLQDRFSGLLYFTLFVAGKQIKPSQGSQLNLAPLMEAIQRDPHGVAEMLRWLDYCFRLGATKGSEDLALAATELVMRWDLDAFEQLVKVLVRFVAQKRIKYENLPDEATVKGVMRYVAV